MVTSPLSAVEIRAVVDEVRRAGLLIPASSAACELHTSNGQVCCACVADSPIDKELAMQIGITVRSTRAGEYFYIPGDFVPICLATPIAYAEPFE